LAIKLQSSCYGDGVAGEGESEGEAAAFWAGAAEEGEHGDLQGLVG
jgi:hypothetical protein